MLDSFMCILNWWTGYIEGIPQQFVNAWLCDMSTYNVLFSTLKHLMTMVQQLYIHSATGSNNTLKDIQN